MIDKEFLKKIENEIGYKPLFHDDYITWITLGVNIVMQFQFLKHNAKFFKNIDINEDIFVTVKFQEISDLIVETDDICKEITCIISDIIFYKKEDKYYIEIYPSFGTYLKFTAKDYEIIK
jgi:hypothetical protein